jgi:molybdate transport system substrate-binding protein
MNKVNPVCLAFLLISPALLADDALIAVAANFTRAAGQLESAFERESQHQVTIATGSTGSLYAQILNGAPYDVLLAADQERPALLLQSADAVGGSLRTYAIGRLVLWSANPAAIQSNLQTTLAQENIATLAIANPALAPYGIASRETLQSLGIWNAVRGKIVMGENVGQTFALIATGNAALGIVSRSQVLNGGTLSAQKFLPVPETLHERIRQDAVLLAHGRDNVAAREFLAFLESAKGKAVIQSNGYGVN